MGEAIGIGLGGVCNRLKQWSASPMMPETDPKIISEKLCQYARANFVAEGVDFDENSPLGKAGIDSFSLVELLLFCERTFGVRVPDSHLTGKNLASMNTLASCIAELARNNH